ncbi:helix-turn-helix transcriptional regulator [Sphaerisporangium sp. NPDC005288]|uniref:helix-turn-helix transcriptional regulator n=1 Tax=Sphaerisporangium sp. NPDC005288 TaxID=3155114 RepID=UPI0033ABDEB2
MSTAASTPEWAANLRMERKARVGSVADMARRLRGIAQEQGMQLPTLPDLTRTIRGWERGDHYPSERYRLLCARALEMTEADLFPPEQATVVPVPAYPLTSIAPDPDLFQRITKAVEQPTRVDAVTLDWLATCLAEHRKVEDSIGSRPLIGVVRQQLGVVADFANSARGPLAERIVDLAAQYAQFIAWMSLDIDDQPAALAWYDRAHDWALEIGDANMATTTLSMKAHQAWSAGNARRCVGLAEAARSHSGQVTPGVRGMAAQMAARGHALAGTADQAHALLDEAETLISGAAEHSEDEPAWMYFYDETWFMLQRGMAELHLSNWAQSVELLASGLVRLPEAYRRDRAWYASCLARAHAKAGDAEASLSTALPIVTDAVQLNRHAVKELAETADELGSRGAPHAVTLRDALAAAR